jgi:hypothetical protein
MKRVIFLGLGFLISLWVHACNGVPIPVVVVDPGPGGAASVTTASGPVSDYATMVEALRQRGASVNVMEMIEQPFFSVAAQVIEVDGASIQVFEFDSAAAAEAASADVNASGTAIGTSMVGWIATPHFYRQGSVIVLYVGDDARLIATLQSLLGPQFAGGAQA